MIESIFDWLNGITPFIVVLGAWIFALITFYRYSKTKAINTLYMTVLSIAIALGWTGITISFFSILFFNYTRPELANIISYFSYSLIPIGSCAVVIIAWDLLFSPKYKKVGLGFFGVLYVIYYIFLYWTWNQTVLHTDPNTSLVYDDWLSWTSVPYWIIWIIVGMVTAMWAIGFNKFRKSSAGELQKRVVNLFLASFFIGAGILLDTVIFIGIFPDYVWISRVIMMPGIYFAYKGLSPI